MEHHQNSPTRRGIAKYITIEPECVEILEKMAVGPQAQGRLLSALIRNEEQRRIEARRWREKPYDVVDEVLA